MKLASKILVELGQVLPEALIEEQDARPFLRPDFQQSVTVPGVTTPIDNVPSGTQSRSFVFGGDKRRTNTGTTAETLAVLTPGYWRIEYNVGFTVLNYVSDVRDEYTLTLGNVRHIFAGVRRIGLSVGSNSIYFSNSMDLLLREDTNIDSQIRLTAAGETLIQTYAFNCLRLL